jgi:hypothetical protein
MAHEKLTKIEMEEYYGCCGNSICHGCSHSFAVSGNDVSVHFVKQREWKKTEEEEIVQMMKRVEGKDAGAMCLLGHYHNQGHFGLLQDQTKAISLWTMETGRGAWIQSFAFLPR